MATIAVFAVIVFLLGMVFGLIYKKACNRRLAQRAQETNELAEKKGGQPPLDKNLSSG